MMNLYYPILFCLASCFCWSSAASWSPSCCLKKSNGKLPARRIISYTIQQAGPCPFEAIVFHTKRGRKLCCDPDMTHAIKMKDAIDKRRQKEAGHGDVLTNPKPQTPERAKKRRRQKGKRRSNKQ